MKENVDENRKAKYEESYFSESPLGDLGVCERINSLELGGRRKEGQRQ